MVRQRILVPRSGVRIPHPQPQFAPKETLVPIEFKEAIRHIDLILTDLKKFANADYGNSAPNFGLGLVMLSATEPIARIISPYKYNKITQRANLAKSSKEITGFTYLKKFYGYFNDRSYSKNAAFISEVLRNGLVHAYTPRKIVNIKQAPKYDESALSGIRYLGSPDIREKDSEHSYLELFIVTNRQGKKRPAIVFDPVVYYEDLNSTINKIKERAGTEPQIVRNISWGWTLLGNERRTDFAEIAKKDPKLAKDLANSLASAV